MNGPDRLGRYTVLRKLGSGGFATVWLARDETLDAEVAIKVLAEHWLDDADVRDRFLAEGRFLRRVDSPHVVGVHDIGETDEGRPFLVLTYADRGTLEGRLKDGPLEVSEAVGVIQQVAAGLRALHNRDLLHRDVKPANVLFRSTPDGERAMVGDLGLGKSLDAVSRLTMPGGTPAYVAPEQVRGDQLDPRADQYALASVAYAALSGRSPYGAKTLGAVLSIDTPPPPLRTVQPDVPEVVDAAVLKGLALDREDRFDDVTAFAEALTAAEPVEVPQRTRIESAGLAVAAPAGQQPRDASPDHTLRPGSVVGIAAATTQAGRPAATGQVGGADDAGHADEAGGSGPASGAGAGEAGSAGKARTRARTRAQTWVAAGVAAAVLGAGGAYAGVRVGTDLQWVEARDRSHQVTLKVPRDWAVQLAGTGWRPPGAKADLPALLLSDDNARWADPANGVNGVFAGELPTNELPKKLDPPAGCRANLMDTGTVDGRPEVTAVFANCPSGRTTYERVVIDAGHALRIQVRRPADDIDDVYKVLDSVRYRP